LPYWSGQRSKCVDRTYICSVIKKLHWFLFVYDLNESAAKPAAGSRPWRTKLLKDLSLLVLFAYSTMIFNMVIPVAADALAHTFWEKEHLASEHQQFGKNHVGVLITKMENQNNKDKCPTNSKTNSEDYTHILLFEDSFNPTSYQLADQAYTP